MGGDRKKTCENLILRQIDTALQIVRTLYKNSEDSDWQVFYFFVASTFNAKSFRQPQIGTKKLIKHLISAIF